MEDITTDLESWLSQRKLWVQNATNRIIKSNIINEDDIDELVVLCKKEAGILEDVNNDLKFIKFSLSPVCNENATEPLVIDYISDLKGMFALSPKKPLQLGKESLTVVYGRNGSGKSSYVKVLKHVCGARKPGELLNNIFEKHEQSKSCNIGIKVGNKQEKIYWKEEDGVANTLKEVEIYDTDCSYVYVNAENEVTYEPSLLTLLTNITNVCIRVGEIIEKEIENNLSKKPLLPKRYINTDGGKWYSNLLSKNSSDISIKCKWNAKLDKELQFLKQRLDTSNPLAHAKSLRNKKGAFNKLIKSIEDLEMGLGNEICNQYFDLKKDYSLKKRVAKEDVDKVLNSTSLEGVGTESWKLMWEQARAYSEKLAYAEKAFPNVTEGARCILCQQPLSVETRKNLVSFEKFIKGNIQQQAVDAEKEFKNFISTIINIPGKNVINLLISACGIVDDKQITVIKSVFNAFELRKNSLLSSITIQNTTEIPYTKFLNEYRLEIEILEESACTFDYDAKDYDRDDIETKIHELEATKWLYEQKSSIEEEIQRLLLVDGLEKAKKLTSTKTISVKKSDLSNKLVTEDYMNRFQKELKLLGANRLKVELKKTKAQKGHIFHQIKFKNCKGEIKVSDVLSEGEMRIVSLAAFLADVESRKNITPFIFDDPISSLDQEYEEATVERLIELSKNRQVIVFTHRLSLLALIEEASKKHSVETSVVSLTNEYWGAGEPNETQINEKSPEKALNSLMNDRLAKAAKTLKEYGQIEYGPIAKSICSDFRIIIERFIENKLLCDVVQRFRRSINTLGKLDKISLITSDDCKIFDDLMTKYSKYEHSQSVELPTFIPSVEELKEDMEKLKNWYAEFKKRIK